MPDILAREAYSGDTGNDTPGRGLLGVYRTFD